jgi:hypothetical protein
VEVHLLDAKGVSTGAIVTLVAENVESIAMSNDIYTELISNEVAPQSANTKVAPVGTNSRIASVASTTSVSTGPAITQKEAPSASDSVPSTVAKNAVPQSQQVAPTIEAPTGAGMPKETPKVLAKTAQVSMRLTVVRGRDFRLKGRNSGKMISLTAIAKLESLLVQKFGGRRQSKTTATPCGRVKQRYIRMLEWDQMLRSKFGTKIKVHVIRMTF